MKLSQQKIVELLESKLLVDKVLGELNFIQELPTSGIVAGQAVASMITDILNISGLNPVVNDIDIFMPFHRSFQMSKETAKFFALKSESFTNELSSIRDIIMEEDYSEIKLSTGPLKYEIIGTTRFKKINKVFVESKHYAPTEKRNNIIFDIINSFDINSTQVGIDINSKKLFYTKNFVYFLFSRQLEIVNWNTPAHSLIRLIRKNNELSSFANFEEANMLASVMIGGYKNISDLINYYTINSDLTRIMTAEEQKKDHDAYCVRNPYRLDAEFKNTIFADKTVSATFGGSNIDYWITTNQSNLSKLPLFFGKKQKADFEKISEKLDNFHLAKRVKPGKKFLDTDFEWFGETKDDSYELHSLLPNNKEKDIEELLSILRSSNLCKHGKSKDIMGSIKTIEKNLHDLNNSELSRKNGVEPFALFYSIPKIMKSFQNIRKNVIYFLNEGESNIFDKSKDVWDAKTKYPLDFFINLNLSAKLFIGSEELNSIDKYELLDFYKKMKKHSELTYLYNMCSFTEIQRINSVLTKLEKDYGELIYGVISRLQFLPKDLTFENVSPYIENLIKIKSIILKERGIDLLAEVGKIKELVSGIELSIEGTEMGHCVGGYTYQVKSGQSLIIAMENRDKKRMTMEIQRNPYFKIGTDTSEFVVNQLFGRFNAKVGYEESIDLLHEVDKIYNIFPLPDGNKSHFFGYHRQAQYNRPILLPEDPFFDINEEEIPF